MRAELEGEKGRGSSGREDSHKDTPRRERGKSSEKEGKRKESEMRGQGSTKRGPTLIRTASSAAGQRGSLPASLPRLRLGFLWEERSVLLCQEGKRYLWPLRNGPFLLWPTLYFLLFLLASVLNRKVGSLQSSGPLGPASVAPSGTIVISQAPATMEADTRINLFRAGFDWEWSLFPLGGWINWMAGTEKARREGFPRWASESQKRGVPQKGGCCP